MKVQLGFAIDLDENDDDIVYDDDEDEYIDFVRLGHRSPNWSNW